VTIHMIRTELDDYTLSKKLSKSFQFEKHSFDEELLKIQYRHDEPVSQKVKYFLNFVLDEIERNTWIDRLFEELFGSEKSVNEELYMNKDDLCFLAKKQQIGSHAHSHLPLAKLLPEECQREISESIEILQEITNSKIHGISYPYGGVSAVSEMLYNTTSLCGLEYGFTMKRGVNSENPPNSFSLNRIDTNDIDQWVEWKFSK
jgi:peptidoglycan/xylan/chitin deacetylase (PgdA/CDA1 family)